MLKRINLETNKQFELVDITSQVKQVVKESGVDSGLVVVFSPHTTAAVRINHNEPMLKQDIMKSLYKLVPTEISYGHDLFELRENIAPNERSNGHAHVEAFLLGSSESLVIEKGELILGDKQSVFFVELDGGRKRTVVIKIISG